MASERDNGERLEPDWGLGAVFDPVSFGRSLVDVGLRLAREPAAVAGASARFAAGLAVVGSTVAARTLGVPSDGPVTADPSDARFADPAWEKNPLFYGLRQTYLLWARTMRELVESVEQDGRAAEKAEFALEQLIDALAPTNFLLANPAALKRAFETGGASAIRGLANAVEDIVSNDGMPRQVDRSAFTIGRDLAATPGRVVFRNRLMELLQYEPQTETVFETPLLFSPPWINKYYVMDLAPGKSFAEWAVQHGHTVFCISYRNPDESLKDVGLEDYLTEGPLQALDVVAEITGQRQANIAALCLGGTLTVMALAHLAGAKRTATRVRSATLLNTLVDFSEPGPLGVFVDPETISRLERKMERRGYLEGREMAGSFNALRANDLVWRYVVSGWLKGEDPPAFDILAWNADSTRMPARMHSEYLRACYLENRLAEGTMELGGKRLPLGRVAADTYVLAAREDHIAPWRSAYRTTQLLGAPPRFVLTSSGHIAGIVNPPGPKRSHFLNSALPPDPDEWLEGAEEHPGTWWEDWAAWIGERAGGRREPPPLGSETHPPLGDAPGDYVLAP